MLHKIEDWSDAYANGPNIPGGERWPGLWVEPAETFRKTMILHNRAQLNCPFGEKTRMQFDLFYPKSPAKGLVVFIHGGFWIRLDKSYWSHLANGVLEHEYAVAIPSYTLCPQTNVSGITAEIGTAINTVARQVIGPIRLIGHSAGGHLVTRMVSHPSPLDQDIQARIAHVVSVSGLHDLRPLLRTDLNDVIGLDESEVERESPALLSPSANLRLTCWVGGNERSEFLRQNSLLANIWKGLGAETQSVIEADKHHFNVLDGLQSPDHPLTRTLMD